MRFNNAPLNCPYCGGEGIIRFSASDGSPYVSALHKKKCKMHPDTWLQQDRDINFQIKMWNMRCQPNE